MAIVRVRMNGNLVDVFNRNDLPISITKQTDNFLQVVGGTSGEVQNFGSSLRLPATHHNCQVFLQSHIPQSYLDPKDRKLYARFTLIVEVDGTVQFSGFATLTKVFRDGHEPKEFAFDSYGDAAALWEQADQYNLTDITGLGIIPYTTAEVKASQVYTPADAPYIFAPVIYGSTTGSPDPSATWNSKQFTTRDFRPAIFEYSIITEFFKTLGYGLESTFLNTDWFKKWVYLFGVGDNWKTAYNANDYRFYANRTINQTIAGSPASFFPVQFNSIVEDTQNGWDAVNFWYTIPVQGRYKVEAYVNGTNIRVWRVEYTDPLNPLPDAYLFYGTFNFGQCQAGFSSSGEINLRAGVRVRVMVRRRVAGSATITAASLRIQLVDEVLVGVDVDAASCLHNNPVKQYLQGVTHRFNLVWFVDDRLKRVYCEPRFAYYLPNQTFNNLERYEGWYKSPSDMQPVRLDLGTDLIELDYQQPFGRFLQLSYKDDNDPVGEWYKQQVAKKVADDLFLYGVQTDFGDRGKDGTVSQNPYFTNLYLGYSTTVATLGYALPIVLPSGTNMDDVFTQDGFGGIIGNLPNPTYESAPKCGMIYYDATYAVHQDEPLTPIFSHALIMQANTLSKNFGFQTVVENNGAYCDTLQFLRNDAFDDALTNGDVLNGLVYNFYRDYLASIRDGLKYLAQLDLTNIDVTTENFRPMRQAAIGGMDVYLILTKISNFFPTLVQPTRCELWQVAQADEELLDAQTEFDLRLPPFSHLNINGFNLPAVTP